MFKAGRFMMTFGLKESDLEYIINTIKQFCEIEKAVIFGSRAMGNYKPGSDIDIAIYGSKVTFNTISSLHSMLEDQGSLPYFIDIINYTHLSNKELRIILIELGKSFSLPSNVRQESDRR